MKENVYFKIDGEWFTDFIRTLYYAEDKSYEECKEKLLNSLCLQELNEEEKNNLVDQVLFGEKKLVGINELDLVDDEEFDVYNYSRIPRPKNFTKNRGVTGILSKDGIFAECEYGSHNSTINFIDNGNQNCSGAVVFSTGSSSDVGINCDSYVYMDTTWSKLSKYQIRWYLKNNAYLNERQRNLFERYMR